ncbi:hypothetical protein PM082_009121 [Marasmius tenuissimus]|nr:hypothetical protein PM082_009121 [Marasmius tenuissimus]
MEKGNLVQFLRVTAREDVDHYTLVYDVASRLAYLHSKIAHGDWKGINILVTGSLRACIADFGLSRVADTQGLRITTSGTRPVGTAWWLAPELLLGGGGPSKESDMYSYTCVCYEIFTGLQPYAELANKMAVAFNVAQGNRPSRPEDISELSDEMWTLMMVAEMTSHELASDWQWSESLSNQVWENVEDHFHSPLPSRENGTPLPPAPPPRPPPTIQPKVDRAPAASPATVTVIFKAEALYSYTRTILSELSFTKGVILDI